MTSNNKSRWWLGKKAIEDAFESLGISEDAEYLVRRSELEKHLLELADQCRLDYGARASASNPDKLVRWCPPELLRQPISRVEFPTRICRCLKYAGIDLVSDLLDWPSSMLLEIPNFGKKSLRDLTASLLCAAQDDSLFERGHMRVTTAPIIEDIADRAREDEEINEKPLAVQFDHFMSTESERNRQILGARFGDSGKVLTLEETGDLHDLTRERIRQIEIQRTKKLRAMCRVEDQVTKRIQKLLRFRDGPLHLATLPAEDSWFEGFESKQLVLAKLLSMFSDGRIRVFDVLGLRVISHGSKDDYDKTKREIKAALPKLVASRPTRMEVEVVAQSIARSHKCEELYEKVLSELSDLCFFSQRDKDEDRLVAFGKSADSLVKAVLEESEFPLHYNDIHQLAEKLGNRKLEVRRVHNSAADIGILLGRGTYGLWKHVAAKASEVRAIVEFVEDLVLETETERQWHCSELIDEIQQASIDAPEDLDIYTLNAILAKSGLTYLGRFVWSLGTMGQHSSRERIDTRQAILAIIRDSGRSLTTDEVRQLLEERRGLSHYFQIHPGGELVRLDDGNWGLLERDVPIGLEAAIEVLDFLESRLRELGHGLTETELIAELRNFSARPQAAQISAPFWMRFALKDGRFRVASENLIWLREWQSPNRMSTSEAVEAVLERANRPLSREEIASKASELAQRALKIDAVSATLRQLGARYSESGRGWLAPD